MLLSRKRGHTPGGDVPQPMQSRTAAVGDNPSGLWKKTLTVCNRSGGEEAFTIGPDGQVWNFLPDVAGQAQGRLVGLGIRADAIAAVPAPNGCLTLFFSSNDTLSYVIETHLDQPRWSDAHPVQLPRPFSEIQITDLIALATGTTVHLAVMARERATQEDVVLSLSARLWATEDARRWFPALGGVGVNRAPAPSPVQWTLH
jgi:hypothetical protein